MRAARAGAALVAAATLLAAAGCDWRAFDDLEKKTPVRNSAAPGSYVDAADFGRVVLPVKPPMDVAARYVVSGAENIGLAIMDLDAAGQPKGQALNPLVINEAGAASITALAEVPGGNQVLMGAAQPTGGRVYLMSLGASPTVTLFTMSAGEARFGLGVAAANLAGAAAADLVVASADALHVYLDGSATTPLDYPGTPPCMLPLSSALEMRNRVNRPVVAGKLLAAGASGIAVGTPGPTGTIGIVALFSVSDAAVTCLGTLTGTGTEPRFGQSLATGDFDNDGVLDLLVGAPPKDAYLFKGPLTSGSTPAARITYADSAGQFGAAVAAFKSGTAAGGDRALIADPDAVVQGKMAAGAVVVYSGTMLQTKDAVLTANEPDDGAHYGASVGGLPFCQPQPTCVRLPLVGADTRTYTHFLLGPSDTDPRRR